jgi:hypothetical protein
LLAWKDSGHADYRGTAVKFTGEKFNLALHFSEKKTCLDLQKKSGRGGEGKAIMQTMPFDIKRHVFISHSRQTRG